MFARQLLWRLSELATMVFLLVYKEKHKDFILIMYLTTRFCIWIKMLCSVNIDKFCQTQLIVISQYLLTCSISLAFYRHHGCRLSSTWQSCLSLSSWLNYTNVVFFFIKREKSDSVNPATNGTTYHGLRNNVSDNNHFDCCENCEDIQTKRKRHVYVTTNEILNGLFVQDVLCPVSETNNCSETNQE